MEYRSLLGQPRELLYLQLSPDSVSYTDMLNVCRSSTKARELCETDDEFQRLKRRKIENLLLELTYPKVKELCEKHMKIQEVCDSDEFWKRKTQRDFGVFYEVPFEGKTWKEEYLEIGKRYVPGLVYAASIGDARKVQEYLDVGVNPNARDKYGNHALVMASQNRKSAVAKMLVDAGADINAQDRLGHDALMFAVMGGKPDVDLVRWLIDKGADVNAQDNYHSGPAALRIASVGGHTDIVEMLIDAGAKE